MTEKEEKFVEADAGDGTRREDQYLEGPHLLLCILSVVLCTFLVGMDQTIVSTLLTDIGNKFHAFGKVEWMTSGFFIPGAVLSANWGQISILLGRKYCMIFSVALFEGGSLMCALSPNMNTLIGGRVLAGIGGSGIQSLTFIIAAEISPINIRPFVFMIMSFVMAISVIVGPLIGGVIASNTTWRWCFYINLPIGGLAIAIFSFVFNPPMPKGNLKKKLGGIDYLGTFLLTGGLVLLLLGLMFASSGEYAWKASPVISTIVLGAVLNIAFCLWNFIYSSHPIIPIEIVKIHQQVTNSAVFFLCQLTFMTTVFFLPLYYQNIFDKGPMESGIALLAIIIPTTIATVGAGALIGKTRYIKPYMIFGTALLLAGCGMLTLLDTDSSLGERIGYVILAGVGSGAVNQPSFISSQVNAPKIKGGVIMTMAFMVFLRGVAGCFSSILGNTVYHSVLSNHLPKAIANAQGDLKSELSQVTVAGLSGSTNILNSLSPEAKDLVKQQMMISIRGVFYMTTGFSAAAFITSIFTSNKKNPGKGEVRTKEEREALDLEKKSDERSEP